MARRATVLALVVGAALAVSVSPTKAATQVTSSGQTWTLENSHLVVSVDAAAGVLAIRDKRGDHRWRQMAAGQLGKTAGFRNVRPLAGPNAGVTFDGDFEMSGKGQPYSATLAVTLRLADDAADLLAEADMADRQTEIGMIAFFQPLPLYSPDAAIVIADYTNGHLYPTSVKPLPRTRWAAWRADMPWIGLCDLRTGRGQALIVQTSDDAFIDAKTVKAEGQEAPAPMVYWVGSKGKFAYPRKVIYHFTDAGGYVALAKRYRAEAARLGLVVPFTEKLKKNPNIARLFGAPDVWGDATLRFAEEAKRLGVEKMLIHGRPKTDTMQQVNDLGYLTSEYDNYTDIKPLEPGKAVDKDHDQIPENVVQKANGQRMTAWLTFDKKTQYMKRCPAKWLPAAQATVPLVLEKYPFLGRFVDVTTAEELYECYDPAHPLTRADKRQCGIDLLAYMRSQGLVVGGEHGIWWCVPQVDYIEGMMSGGSASWPAGHLIRPKTKDQEFTSPQGHKLPPWSKYEQWGIGYAYRLPLWELVFHDCIVSTWYWGDASDFLIEAAPEITAKKIAFNVLYGTPPLLWANKEGSWNRDRDTFLRIYRETCKLHAAIATAELVSHELVTPDRAVQRTRFSDGTQVIVNFGGQPYKATLAGKDYLLPQDGYAVTGPRIEQRRTLVDGRIVVRIDAGEYHFEQ